MSRARSIHDLVEYQARWGLLRRLLEERPAPAEGEEHHWISISRQVGSGGNALARAIGERLGWRVLDREIVAEIAREAHRPEPVIAAHDERPSRPLDDYLSYLIVPGDPGRTRFIEEMVSTIRSLTRSGNAVILGRGANWFLDASRGLRLRVVAPLDYRTEELASRLGLRREDAARRVRELDAEQKTFIRQSFGHDVDDPLGYDMVLNLGAMDADAAAGIVLAALERRFAGVSGA
jgi:cytidylate kinase